MPSKGGRGTTTTNPAVGPPVVAGPAVGRTREEWDTAGFTVAEIGRALRRGIDVERLNELAAREDGLVPEEAEELYRYRLRRAQSRLASVGPRPRPRRRRGNPRRH